ncbi:MAG: DUF4249 domain-containing protein, partial [Chitinophagaceae bacterium]|nr:DUF4249 domain-containing protein [Chitinophagaceae bacterium]
MKKTFISLLLSVLFAQGCREEYLPPAIATKNNFLVVEGFINSGNDSTIIKLSRTKNLSDTTFEIPELNATVIIRGKSGSIFNLPHQGAGRYASAPLALNSTDEYQLKINTAGGSSYESDYVKVKQTPEIDSISWKQDRDATIFVSTHDATNSTRFYRWEFIETWEYHSYYDSNLGYDYVANQLFYLDSSQLRTVCFLSARSTDVYLSTSKNLSDDVIENFPLSEIPNGSDKIGVRYSILVKQYAMSQTAFQYWQQIRKNAKELGSIFGTQPAELIGNLHSITNPNEPVIGYMSASSVSEKRIFIRNNQLVNWSSRSSQDETCEPILTIPDSASYYLQNFRDLGPAYFITGGGLAIAKKTCV